MDLIAVGGELQVVLAGCGVDRDAFFRIFRRVDLALGGGAGALEIRGINVEIVEDIGYEAVGRIAGWQWDARFTRRRWIGGRWGLSSSPGFSRTNFEIACGVPSSKI